MLNTSIFDRGDTRSLPIIIYIGNKTLRYLGKANIEPAKSGTNNQRTILFRKNGTNFLFKPIANNNSAPKNHAKLYK